jgi:carbonic anhydrase
MCSTGNQQSPIIIDDWIDVDDDQDYVVKLTLDDSSNAETILSSDGNVYEITRTNKNAWGTLIAYTPETLQQTTYNCNALYFHAPSEHKIEDDFYDMEVQLKCDLAAT